MRTSGDPDRPTPLGSRPGTLWIILLLLHASLYVFLIADRRLERKHATREAYESQRAVLSGAATASSRDQGGLLHHAIQLAMVPLERANPLVLFHLGLFFDELIYLLGVWLLARSIFADPRTTFFISAAALGSCFWAGNAGMNFRLTFALPLVVHLGREFFREGSPWMLFGALNLSAIQALGNPMGLGFLTPLGAVFLIALLPRSPITLRWNRWHAAAGLAGLATWIPVALVSVHGFQGDPLAARSWGATALAATGLGAPANLLDLVLGIGPNLDYSLFCGFLTLAFAILGLVQKGPKWAARLTCAAAAGLLLLGLLATVSLHGLRPSAVGAPLFRLLLVLLAGAGFDAALQGSVPRGTSAVAAGLLVLALALLGLSMGVQFESQVPARATALFTPQDPGSLSPAFESSVLCELLDTSALFAGVSGGLLLLLRSRSRAVPLALALILFLHPLEIFSWKFRMTWLLTSSLDAGAAEKQRLPEHVGHRGGSARLFLGLNAAAWLLLTLRKSGALHRPPKQRPAAG